MLTLQGLADGSDDRAAARHRQVPSAPENSHDRAHPPRQAAAAAEVQHRALAQVVYGHDVCGHKTQMSHLSNVQTNGEQESIPLLMQRKPEMLSTSNQLYDMVHALHVSARQSKRHLQDSLQRHTPIPHTGLQLQSDL